MLGEKIRSLKLAAPLVVSSGSSVRQVIETVQQHHAGAVLVCAGARPVGIMTERDVLMKIVARDVNQNDAVDGFMTPDPETLTGDATIGEAISLMNRKGFRNIPIVDAATGEAKAIFRIADIIHHLAESFPAHLLNLPPRPDQQMKTPEGA